MVHESAARTTHLFCVHKICEDSGLDDVGSLLGFLLLLPFLGLAKTSREASLVATILHLGLGQQGQRPQPPFRCLSQHKNAFRKRSLFEAALCLRTFCTIKAKRWPAISDGLAAEGSCRRPRTPDYSPEALSAKLVRPRKRRCSLYYFEGCT